MADPKTVYDFSLETLQGSKPLPLSQFKGQPLLIVNTASQCGFTYQYKGLEAVWQENRDKGLVVIGVPSNDFGRQEPGKASEIAEFCEINFGVDFPLAAKTPVSGKEAHPLFKYLGDQGGFLSRPRWNFYKYVIGRDGKLVTWFSSITKPDSATFKRAISKVVRK
jgi:glutathione peroxidase